MKEPVKYSALSLPPTCCANIQSEPTLYTIIPTLLIVMLALAAPFSALGADLSARAALRSRLTPPTPAATPAGAPATDDSARVPMAAPGWFVRGFLSDAEVARLDAHHLFSTGGPVYLVHRSLNELLDLPDGIRIEAPAQFVPLLDVAMPALHIDKVVDPPAGAPLATGKGVLLALIDTGIDVNHEDFKNADGSSRFFRYWDQSLDGERIAAWLGFGTECDSLTINRGDCQLDDESVLGGVIPQGHGTHVAGIATSGHKIYQGAAPGATLVGVRALFDEASIVVALEYAYRLHQMTGWPMVVNLSLGTNEGAHDGSSVLENWIDDHVEGGFLVVAAMGNEALADASMEGGIHIGLRVGSVDGRAALFTFGGRFFASSVLGISEWFVDGQSSDDLWVFALDSQQHVMGTPLHLTAAQIRTGGEASLDSETRLLWAGDYNSTLDRTDFAVALSGEAGTSLAGRTYGFLFSGSDFVDGWVSDRSGIFAPAAAALVSFTAASKTVTARWYGGDSTSTLTNPASGRSVLAVGSYVGRLQWPSVDGNRYGDTRLEEGQISDSSSRGPSRDGRQKPEVVAPGQYVASTRSNNLSAASLPAQLRVDDAHWISYGTSMASPMAAGAAALILQVAPELDISGVRSLLQDTARDPYDFAPLPNPIFGFGAVDLSAVFADSTWQKAVPDQTAPTIRELRVHSAGGGWVVSWSSDELADAEVSAEGAGRTKLYRSNSYDWRHEVQVNDPGFVVDRLVVSSSDIATNRSIPLVYDAVGGCSCQVVGGGVGLPQGALFPVLLIFFFRRRLYA